MKKIYLNFIAPLDEQTGYGVHATSLYAALKDKIAINSYPILKLHSSQIQERINRFAAHTPALKPINLILSLPSGFLPYKDLPGIKIGYTALETEYIHPEWKKAYEIVDCIWVPSLWAKNVLIHHGFKDEKIVVVPEGVDPTLFYPSHNIKKKNDVLNFVHVGKLEERKGTDILIQAFDSAFKDKDKVKLHLVTHNIFSPNTHIKSLLKNYGVTNPSHYQLYQGSLMGAQKLRELYQEVDVGIFPSRAEGWGLPIIESMACGLPIIAPYYSGQSEYLTSENAIALDYDRVLNLSKSFHKMSGINQEAIYHGVWAEPSVEHLIELLRFAYHNPKKMAAIGECAAKDIQNNWRWEDAGAIAMNTISTLI